MHPSRGKIVDHGNGLRTITLDRSLSQRDRKCVLSHEVVHDEYDLLWPADAPEGLVAKGERFVERVSDERLVPPTELREWIDRRPDDLQVVSWMVAEQWDVSIDVAARSLDRLAAGF